MNASHWQGRVAVITGGGSGLGAALAAALSRHGARVIVTDIDTASAHAVLERGDALEAHGLDVTDAPALDVLVSEVVARHGRLDYFFNNAGISVCGDARDLEVAHWRRVLEVNLMGVVHGTHAAYPQMCRQGYGHLVNIASLAGLLPFPTNLPYAASKHAVVGLSLSLRAEGVALGVKVSAVCPGFIQSNIYQATSYINVRRERVLASMPFTPMPVERAATLILEGVQRNQPLIVFPAYARWLWRLERLWPGVLEFLGRKTIRDLRRSRLTP